MAITAGNANSWKQDAIDGVHQPGDNYKIALYTSAATLNKSTTAYTSSNEAAGSGYTAGGMSLSGRVSGLSGDTAYMHFTVNPQWTNTSITARGALIYNATRGNKAVTVLDFGADFTSTNGNFLVQLPAAGVNAEVTIS
jgi:hypothetical protein